jgi:hypothetical protein
MREIKQRKQTVNEIIMGNLILKNGGDLKKAIEELKLLTN